MTSGLEVPTPFAAADVIVHDDRGRLSFHYAIIEVRKRASLPHVHASWAVAGRRQQGAPLDI